MVQEPTQVNIAAIVQQITRDNSRLCTCNTGKAPLDKAVPFNMAGDGMDLFDHRRAQVCTTSRKMIYTYYDFQPERGQCKTVALLLHGHGDLSLGWRTTIPSFLARGIRCIVPDLLGFGQSSKPVDPGAYRLLLMATDMCEVVADAGVQESVRVESPQIQWLFDLHNTLTDLPVPYRYLPSAMTGEVSWRQG